MQDSFLRLTVQGAQTVLLCHANFCQVTAYSIVQ